jgi:hypothetical protein
MYYKNTPIFRNRSILSTTLSHQHTLKKKKNTHHDKINTSIASLRIYSYSQLSSIQDHFDYNIYIIYDYCNRF